MDPREFLREAYEPLIGFAESIDEATGWSPTALPGWTVRDLMFHLVGDAQRALVAFATPADAGPDTDEVSYWSHWQPGSDPEQKGLRGTRISASVWSTVRGPAQLHAETARAVLHVAAEADPARVVRTQGHALKAAALVHTLAVEATVHHLDLIDAIGTGPDARCLAEVTRVLDGLFGAALPSSWEPARTVLLGTGRAEPTGAERAQLGAAADRLPLFG